MREKNKVTTSTEPKERAVLALLSHTFKDSGITIRLRKLGPNIIDNLQAALRAEWRISSDPDHAEPQPPTLAIDDLPRTPNRADPDYLSAHTAWRGRFMNAVYERLLTFAALWAVECEVDSLAVEHYRKMARLTDIPLPTHPNWEPADQNKVIYITRIAIATNEDLSDFRKALLHRTESTEQGVANTTTTGEY